MRIIALYSFRCRGPGGHRCRLCRSEDASGPRFASPRRPRSSSRAVAFRANEKVTLLVNTGKPLRAAVRTGSLGGFRYTSSAIACRGARASRSRRSAAAAAAPPSRSNSPTARRSATAESTLFAQPFGGLSLDSRGAQPTQTADRARARPRHARALRHRLRQRRLLDLLRARPHGRLRARADAARLRRRRASSSPCTAATYAEGTVRYPGGRRLVQLRPARVQRARLLRGGLGADARLRRHGRHLGVLRAALPLDLLGAAERRTRGTSSAASIVIVVLVVLNIVGVQEAAKLSIMLAVVDFATQLLLVALGFVLVFSPEILVDNVHWGVAPTWSNLALAIPVAMLAYTGIETVSNLAEEVRDPVRTSRARTSSSRSPSSRSTSRCRSIALSALPVKEIDGELTTLLALPPEEGGYANDPVLGLVENLGRRGCAARRDQDLRRHPRRDDPLHRDERGRDRRLPDHLLDGELPAAPGGLPAAAPAVQDARGSRSSSSPGSLPIARHPARADVNFLGTIYSFGATLSFTVAHASIVRLRMRPAGGRAALPRAAEPPDPAASTGRSSRSSAGSRPALVRSSSSSRTRRRAGPASAGSRSASRSTSSTAAASCTRLCARPCRRRRPTARRSRSSTGACSCPVLPGQASDDAFDVAASLAAERGAQIVAVNVIEIPLELPLATDTAGAGGARGPRARRGARDRRLLRRRRDPAPRCAARSAGAAIVEEAARRGTEIIVIGAPKKDIGRRKRAVFGRHRRLRAQERALPRDGDGVEGGRMKALPRRGRRARRHLRRDRDRAARRHGRERRRRPRLRPRRPLHRARRRAADAAPAGRR